MHSPSATARRQISFPGGGGPLGVLERCDDCPLPPGHAPRAPCLVRRDPHFTPLLFPRLSIGLQCVTSVCPNLALASNSHRTSFLEQQAQVPPRFLVPCSCLKKYRVVHEIVSEIILLSHLPKSQPRITRVNLPGRGPLNPKPFDYDDIMISS
jgi:hypothetical protein